MKFSLSQLFCIVVILEEAHSRLIGGKQNCDHLHGIGFSTITDSKCCSQGGT